jgi:hypothetical protein
VLGAGESTTMPQASGSSGKALGGYLQTSGAQLLGDQALQAPIQLKVAIGVTPTGPIQEAYVHGVSTRSVDDLVKAMGPRASPRAQVSRLSRRSTGG